MSNTESLSTQSNDTGELELLLGDLAHLFNAPSVTPLAAAPAEALGVSGVEYLLELLHLDKQKQRATKLVLLLPQEKAASASIGETSRALHRYVELRLQRERRELHNTYRYGWRVALLSLLMLAICLGVSSLFTNDVTAGMRPLMRTTFSSGFEIIGWVLLWHPIDVLAFGPLAIHARMAALKTLSEIEVVFATQPTQPAGSHH